MRLLSVTMSVLAAAGLSGLAGEPAGGAPKPAAGASVKEPAPAAAAPAWLGADGRPDAEQGASPASALAWADLLAAEGSYAAASRAYEGLVRRWPAAPEAPGAMLAAARSALAAGDHDRTERLANELRGRWRAAEHAGEQDQLLIALGESRLGEALSGRQRPGDAAEQARRAMTVFGVILAQDRTGPLAERAAFGRARAWLAQGKTAKGIAALEQFLKDYPRSPLVPDARGELAAANTARVRNRSQEGEVLADARESAEWARQGGAASPGPASDAIAETYRSIAARQAELKIEEARLYLRLRQRRAAETVLRSVLGRYGDTPSAEAAAVLLEELAER